MEKIQMTTPIVEMDGDEMTRILWKMIKDELILPFVDLKSEYYDLGLPYRDQTNDQVTIDAANANKKYGVAVKCATITPNHQRMDEYKLHQMWKSPNGTIRSILDGTVFRAPIQLPSIKPQVRSWEKPITIARHAYGDVYKGVEVRCEEAGVAKLVFEGKSGKKEEVVIHEFDGPGIIQGMHNVDKSIRSFAHACSHTVGDLTNGHGSAHGAAVHTDHVALEHLDTFLFTFDDTEVHFHKKVTISRLIYITSKSLYSHTSSRSNRNKPDRGLITISHFSCSSCTIHYFF